MNWKISRLPMLLPPLILLLVRCFEYKGSLGNEQLIVETVRYGRSIIEEPGGHAKSASTYRFSQWLPAIYPSPIILVTYHLFKKYPIFILEEGKMQAKLRKYKIPSNLLRFRILLEDSFETVLDT